MNFNRKHSDCIWETTDRIIIHNYPASPGTYSYLCRVYRIWPKDAIGYKEWEGEPIYFKDLSDEDLSVAVIMAIAQNQLDKSLPLDKLLYLSEEPI